MTRPIADTSLPLLPNKGSLVWGWQPGSEVRQPESEVGYDEDRLTHWRALALFGGLVIVEGSLLAMIGPGYSWFGLALVFWPLFVLVSVATTIYYGASFLGASAISFVLYLSAANAGVPANTVISAPWVVPVALGLMLAGSTLLAMGVVRDIQIARELDPDSDS
jgi:hypothetical protein